MSDPIRVGDIVNYYGNNPDFQTDSPWLVAGRDKDIVYLMGDDMGALLTPYFEAHISEVRRV